jgi:hypothetical protein
LRSENIKLKDELDIQQATINSYRDQEVRLSKMAETVRQLNDEKQKMMQAQNAKSEIEERCRKEMQEYRDSMQKKDDAWPQLCQGIQNAAKDATNVKDDQKAKNVPEVKGVPGMKNVQDMKRDQNTKGNQTAKNVPEVKGNQTAKEAPELKVSSFGARLCR